MKRPAIKPLAKAEKAVVRAEQSVISAVGKLTKLFDAGGAFDKVAADKWYAALKHLANTYGHLQAVNRSLKRGKK